MDSWLALPAGILIATVVSTVGIGGGILWMPYLLIVSRLRPDTAVVTSLMIQSAGMGSGSFAFLRQGRVDSRLALILLVITVPGIAAGAALTKMTTPMHLELILGLLTLVTAFYFVAVNQKYAETGRLRADVRHVKRSAGLVSLMAVASGMLSISVGEWLVPLMRNRLALSMATAIGTSIATIFGTCVLGTLFHLLMGGRVDWDTIVWAVPGVLIGGQIGPRVAEQINDRLLKEIFVFLLTLIGIHLIYNSY